MNKKLKLTARTVWFDNVNFITMLSLSLVLVTNTVWAADAKSLAKASQNPVAAMISVPFENNATFDNGPDDVFVNVLNIKPVVPMSLTDNWNLFRRDRCHCLSIPSVCRPHQDPLPECADEPGEERGGGWPYCIRGLKKETHS